MRLRRPDPGPAPANARPGTEYSPQLGYVGQLCQPPPETARRLREAGCERDDPRACRGLLHQRPTALDPSALERLELKTCLIGDVNDCRPLMRRDLEEICALVCAGSTESQWHTCGYCAKDALAAGKPETAEAWLASTCQRGYGWGCRDLEELRRQARPGTARVTPERGPR